MVVTVKSSLEWSGKGYTIWFICSLCGRCYEEEHLLFMHKKEIHFPKKRKEIGQKAVSPERVTQELDEDAG